MVHTTLEVKLGKDLSCFTQHLKSNWMGNGPLLFHTMVEVKPCSYSLLHKNQVNIKKSKLHMSNKYLCMKHY